VVKESPAQKAGIKNGDIITDFDGKKIREMHELTRLVAATPVGKKVKLGILRNGKAEIKKVTIERLKEGAAEGQVTLAQDKIGLTVAELTPALATKLGVKTTSGIVVTEVKPGGLAEGSGIAPGDIIKEVDGVATAGVADFEKAVAAHKKGDILRLLLQRGDTALYVALTME
jgi:serine protease Do